ncbi:MAG: MaoC family dehydratase [Pseudomonadales bacterium]|nr:MaoC family dehydratase [Pseudomonadales bacterium]
MTFEHLPDQEISQEHNRQFCLMTRNPQPLHLDEEFAAASPYGQIIVNSLYTLGLLIGVSVEDTTLGTTLGNLGMEKTEFPNPVFIGDTLKFRTEVQEKRESRSKPDRGIVWFRHTAVNQRNELVCECIRKAMMLRGSAG